MKRMGKMLSVILTALSSAVVCADVNLPIGVVKEKLPAGLTDSWKELGALDLTFTAALEQFERALKKGGWKRLDSFDYDRRGRKKIEIWARGGERIMFHFWRENAGRTGFSWGELEKNHKEKPVKK